MTDTTIAAVIVQTIFAFCTRCDRLAYVPIGGPDGLCTMCAHAEAADHWRPDDPLDRACTCGGYARRRRRSPAPIPQSGGAS